MISVMNVVPGKSGRLVLESNNSLSWQGNIGFLISMLAMSLVISIAFVMAGAWLAIPFVIVEMLLLAVSLYYVKRQLGCIEVISIDRDRVLVEKGCRCAEDSWEFNRQQARVLVEVVEEPLDCYNVSLSGEQGMLLLGEAMSLAERDELVDSLQQCGLRTYEPGNAVIFSA